MKSISWAKPQKALRENGLINWENRKMDAEEP